MNAKGSTHSRKTFTIKELADIIIRVGSSINGFEENRPVDIDRALINELTTNDFFFDSEADIPSLALMDAFDLWDNLQMIKQNSHPSIYDLRCVAHLLLYLVAKQFRD
jgi:hypothetical protein